MMGNEPKMLIAMVGLPRSGKSTLARALSKRLGAPIVSRDALRLAIHGQRYLPPVEPLIKTLDVYMIKALFIAGHSMVICDETNYSKEAREHMMSPDWKTTFYVVPTPPNVCKERAVQTGQKDLIPVIDEMSKRMDLPTSHIYKVADVTV